VAKPKHGASSGARATLVATGRAHFARAGKVTIAIKLTAKGKRLLRHAKRFPLTFKATVTPTGQRPETETGIFTLLR
jgi:hypothetical protein